MSGSTRIAAVIVAAGRGTRAGAGLPKQWRDLRGRTVAARAIEAFRSHPSVSRTVLVLHPDDMGLAAGWRAHGDMAVAMGGTTRGASVRAGLEALVDQGIDRVLIHDVARPLVPRALIDRVIAALDGAPGAAPAIAVTDALWTGRDGGVTGSVDRQGLFRAQTPQGFRFQPIMEAHRDETGGAPDDVAVALRAGLDVSIVQGDERNLKITGAEDFARAQAILEAEMDIRVGNGFDVHAFTHGNGVTLCGIAVPHDRALLGHSDADVGMHAVTDAIYGALAEGDIGRHFPPSDPQWKGAASRVFLTHAAELARARGYAVSNVDVTLICEMPKIGPHARTMAAELAAIIGISPERISVKATTSEGLGFAGRQEGIAAMSAVCLVSQ